MSEADPKLAVQRWEEIKREALAELKSGHRMAQTMEGYYDAGPWEKAQILAIRRDLEDQCTPRNGLERSLFDMMAQALAAVHYWTRRLACWLSTNAASEQRHLKEFEGWRKPSITEAEAIEQAAGMVDRFNRIFLRTARTLRELRRTAPPLIVQNAGQVKVGQQQVNLAGSLEK